MRSLLVFIIVLAAFAATAQPEVRKKEMLMQTAGDNQTAIAIYVQTNQTLPFLDFWFGATEVFQVSSNGTVTAGTNTAVSVGTQSGTCKTSADGTVTNAFSVVYTAAPIVLNVQQGLTNSVTNVVTVTSSNFVLKTGVPGQTNNWHALPQTQ